ncbi:aspartate/methionine/tyrosine aminotransferase [Microvirga flocculans]|uniref:8-amino-7-oxononanoate synthase n=1 Tax=Microvirga flocculans TaxID=217168 RepID=A0A7W6N9M7_9HYPH|nr:aminotransferase [Microvirga flocculans]MBB4041670.1 aspartate/methionine/tyrosine aminotransferase [Microvirga flocculans]
MIRGLAHPINPLVADVGTPPIPEAQAWTRRYGGTYGPLINLSQAVPGNAPHDGLLERMASVAASAAGSQYGPINGDAPLREAYAAELSRIYEGRIAPEDTAVTAGCNMAFFAAMMLLARQGEAVLLPTPWYFNHQMSLDMLGIEPRPLPCRAEAGFVPRIEDAEALIDEKVRAIVLVTPNNPTGAVYPAHVIESFAQLCRNRGIYLVIDETYRDFLPQGMNRAHGLFTGEEWRDTVIQLYSFSKSYAIPGHRTGAITADARIVEQIAKILDCIQICAPRTAQGALPWAIEALRDWREANRAEINRRAQVFQAALAPLPEWRIESVGAYFAYLSHPFRGRRAQEVAEKLATERGVLCLPGSYFGPGQEGHLRVAIANVGSDILQGLTERFRGLTL